MREQLLKCFFFNVLKGQAKIARGNAPGRRQHGDQALKGRANGISGQVISRAPTELVPGWARVPGALPLAIFASPFRGTL